MNRIHHARTAVLPALAVAMLALGGCADADPLGPGTAERVGVPDASAAALGRPASAPVIATFSKGFMPEEGPETLLVWYGTVTLDGVTGALVSTIDLADPATRWAGATLHATVRWVVTGALEIEFETNGVVNLTNGIVRTNGRVVSGPYAGSQVHQQGQLDLDRFDAHGFFRIHPATGP